MLERQSIFELGVGRYYDDRALTELELLLDRLCREFAVTDRSERLNIASLLFEASRVTEKPARVYQLVRQVYATRH
jgi:hypothetical protein